jgi:hypothetical protein
MMRKSSSQSAQGETRLELREIIPLLLQSLGCRAASPSTRHLQLTQPPRRSRSYLHKLARTSNGKYHQTSISAAASRGSAPARLGTGEKLRLSDGPACTARLDTHMGILTGRCSR